MCDLRSSKRMASWKKKNKAPGNRSKWAFTSRCLLCGRRLSDRRYKHCATCTRRARDNV